MLIGYDDVAWKSPIENRAYVKGKRMIGRTRTWLVDRLGSIRLGGLLVPAVFAALLGASGPGNAASDDAAYFVDQLGSQTIQTLQATDLTRAQRTNQLRGLLAEGFDLAFIGRFTLGKYWRMATPDQRTAYLALVGEYLLQTYTARLEGYAGEAMVVVGARQANDKDVVVRVHIAGPGGQTLVADWRVRATANGYRIIDVAIEGISLAITHRSEFAAVVQRHGIDGLLSILRDHTATAQTTAALY